MRSAARWRACETRDLADDRLLVARESRVQMDETDGTRVVAQGAIAAKEAIVVRVGAEEADVVVAKRRHERDA